MLSDSKLEKMFIGIKQGWTSIEEFRAWARELEDNSFDAGYAEAEGYQKDYHAA